MKKLIPVGQQFLSVFLSFALLFSSAAPALADIGNNVTKIEELKQVLKKRDLSARERKFIQLEIQFLNGDTSAKKKQEKMEQLTALENFYVLDGSHKLWKAIWVMHQLAEEISSLETDTDSLSQLRREATSIQSDMVSSVASLGKNNLVGLPKKSIDQLIEEGSNGNISPADLVESIDPLESSIDYKQIAVAAGILFGIFLSYNYDHVVWDEKDLVDAVWVARRAYYRAHYSMLRLAKKSDPGVLPALGYLMLVKEETSKFVQKHQAETSSQNVALIKASESKVKEQLRKAPEFQFDAISIDSLIEKISKSDIGIEDISSVVTYCMMMKCDLSRFEKSVNKGQQTLRKDGIANVFFSAIYINLLNLPITKEYVKSQLAPFLQKVVSSDNSSITYKIEAIKLASMLRQIASKGVITGPASSETPQLAYLQKNDFKVFDEEDFRKQMA